MKLPACVNDIITWDLKQNIEIHADKLSLVQPLNCQSLSHYIERRTEIPRDDNRLYTVVVSTKLREYIIYTYIIL